jgi:TolA-binding protein
MSGTACYHLGVIMTRRLSLVAVLLVVFTTGSGIPRALAIDEAERLWLVGDRAFADGLHPLARRTLERFVDRYPNDARVPQALLMLGKSRLALGDADAALEALRRAAKSSPPPGKGFETRFWEGEALFRLKRYAEARAAYEEVLRQDAHGPLAPDALYGYGWTELELKRPEPAATAFGDFLKQWPDHALAPSATYQLGRALVQLKRGSEAVPLLRDFPTKYPDGKLVPDARYLLGVARLGAGETKAGVADLKAFADAYPNHEMAPDARRLITQTAARSGDKTELLATYHSLMAQSPPKAESLAEALTIATRLARPKEQEAAWRKLRTQFPQSAVTQRTAFDLANAAFKRKSWRDASAYASVAAQSEDDGVRAEALELTGESELKLKRFGPAVKAFEAVGAMSEIDPGVRYRALAGLGLAREEQKELKAALTAYESVASKSPDSALRDWARERVSAVRERLARPATTPSGKSSKSTKSKAGS